MRFLRCLLLVYMVMLCTGLTANAETVADRWYYVNPDDWRFFSPDKFQHYYGTYFLTQTVGPVEALGLGLIKEIYDDQVMGVGFSYKDILADGLGAASALLNGQDSRIITWLAWRQDRGDLMLTVTFRAF